jgi:hypothetical protein
MKERKGENKSRKQPIEISSSYYQTDLKYANVEDHNFNSYTLYKRVAKQKDVPESINQSSIRKLILVSSTDKIYMEMGDIALIYQVPEKKIEINIGEIKQLLRNEHPKIKLQPHSINYIKRVVLGYGGK